MTNKLGWFSISELHRNGMVMGYKRAKILELVKMGYIKAKKGPGKNCKIMISEKEINKFLKSDHYIV